MFHGTWVAAPPQASEDMVDAALTIASDDQQGLSQTERRKRIRAQYSAMLGTIPHAPAQVVIEDLCALVSTLARAVHAVAPQHPAAAHALDYLQRMGLTVAAQPVSSCPDAQSRECVPKPGTNTIPGVCVQCGDIAAGVAPGEAPVPCGDVNLFALFEAGWHLRGSLQGHVLDGRDVCRVTTCDFWPPYLQQMHVGTDLHVGLTVPQAMVRLKQEIKRRLDGLQEEVKRTASCQQVHASQRDVLARQEGSPVQQQQESGPSGQDFHGDGLGIALFIVLRPGREPAIRRPGKDLVGSLRSWYRANPGAEIFVLRSWSDSIGCQRLQDGHAVLAAATEHVHQ